MNSHVAEMLDMLAKGEHVDPDWIKRVVQTQAEKIVHLRAELAERDNAVPDKNSLVWRFRGSTDEWVLEINVEGEAVDGTYRFSGPTKDDAIAMLTAAPEARSDDRESGEKCGACGCRYQTIYRVPDDVWRKIAPNPEQLGNPGEHMGGLLCVDCAWSRAKDAGTILYFEGCADWWPDEARSEGITVHDVEKAYGLQRSEAGAEMKTEDRLQAEAIIAHLLSVAEGYAQESKKPIPPYARRAFADARRYLSNGEPSGQRGPQTRE